MNIINIILGLVAPEIKVLLKVAKLLRFKPDQLVRLSKNTPSAIIKRIESIPSKSQAEFASIFENIVSDPKKVSQQLGDLGKKGRKTFSELVDGTTKTDETNNLSSSWITKGHYVTTSIGTSGELTIWTKKGGKYTYPGVPIRVWRSMKGAKGQNGSGAGSVFWALYLRGYNKSFTGGLLKKLGKLSGFETSPSNIRDLRG